MSSLSSPIDLAVLFAGLFLGQEKAAPEGAPSPPGPDPGAGAGGGGGGPAGGMGGFLVPLLLIFLVFWFLIIMPERRKQKAKQAMIGNVKKGDQVVTNAGILGKVVKVEDREVVLQVDRENDVRMRFLKSAVHEVLPEPASDAAPAPREGS